MKPHSTLLKIAAMGAILALAVLSLLPGAARPHTGASGNLEHLLAYTGAAALLVLAFPVARSWRAAAALAVMAAVLEILQLWIPGRSAGLDNWAFSSLGAGLGALAGTAWLRLTRQGEGA
jgi:VanZ family protein